METPRRFRRVEHNSWADLETIRLFLDLLGSDARGVGTAPKKKALVTSRSEVQLVKIASGNLGVAALAYGVVGQTATVLIEKFEKATAGDEVAGTDRVADDEEHRQQPIVGKFLHLKLHLAQVGAKWQAEDGQLGCCFRLELHQG